jgi:hypothetical protein
MIACCLAVVFCSAPGDAASTAVIQPGARITMGGDGCTANWVYLGTGKLRGQQFLGTARHCVSGVGEPVYLTDGPFPVSFAPTLRIGKVAYISRALDFALVTIDRSNFRYITASMAGHPDIPQRVGTSTDTNVDDVCQFSGHGVGFDGQQQTEQSRTGLLAYIDRDQQYCDGPVSNGDSGGPVADTTAGNAAIGIVDTAGVEVGGSITAAVGEGGVALTGLLADAAAHRFPIRLRTVSTH